MSRAARRATSSPTLLDAPTMPCRHPARRDSLRANLTIWTAALALACPAGIAVAADPHAAPDRAHAAGKHDAKADAKADHKADAAADKGKGHDTKAGAPRDKAAQKHADTVDAHSLERLRERLVERVEAVKPRPEVVKVTAKSGGPAATHGHGAPAAAASPAALAAAHRAHVASTPTAHANGHANEHAHWAYQGHTGPDAWGQLEPGFSACATGQRQSPIDIRGGIRVDLEPVQFDYRASGFTVVDNGHTIQVNVSPGNSISVMGRRYELLQFHFHRPSEERIDGRQFDMVAHLVHKDVEGRLAVVAVLLDRGSAHPLVQTVWNHMPLEKGDSVRAASSIDVLQLLPQDRRYYTYMGSLTTPPCSEGVLWMVMAQPVGISPEQIATFSHLYPMNARPIQPASGRLIKAPN
jgi:carbonic anhydrase